LTPGLCDRRMMNGLCAEMGHARTKTPNKSEKKREVKWASARASRALRCTLLARVNVAW
jgi:hypothetical protein